jgi:hypothetical protein
MYKYTSELRADELGICSKFDPTLHSCSSGIRPPTNMANPSLQLESYIYALDDHLQTF